MSRGSSPTRSPSPSQFPFPSNTPNPHPFANPSSPPSSSSSYSSSSSSSSPQKGQEKEKGKTSVPPKVTSSSSSSSPFFPPSPTGTPIPTPSSSSSSFFTLSSSFSPSASPSFSSSLRTNRLLSSSPPSSPSSPPLPAPALCVPLSLPLANFPFPDVSHYRYCLPQHFTPMISKKKLSSKALTQNSPLSSSKSPAHSSPCPSPPPLPIPLYSSPVSSCSLSPSSTNSKSPSPSPSSSSCSASPLPSDINSIVAKFESTVQLCFPSLTSSSSSSPSIRRISPLPHTALIAKFNGTHEEYDALIQHYLSDGHKYYKEQSSVSHDITMMESNMNEMREMMRMKEVVDGAGNIRDIRNRKTQTQRKEKEGEGKATGKSENNESEDDGFLHVNQILAAYSFLFGCISPLSPNQFSFLMAFVMNEITIEKELLSLLGLKEKEKEKVKEKENGMEKRANKIGRDIINITAKGNDKCNGNSDGDGDVVTENKTKNKGTEKDKDNDTNMQNESKDKDKNIDTDGDGEGRNTSNEEEKEERISIHHGNVDVSPLKDVNFYSLLCEILLLRTENPPSMNIQNILPSTQKANNTEKKQGVGGGSREKAAETSKNEKGQEIESDTDNAKEEKTEKENEKDNDNHNNNNRNDKIPHQFPSREKLFSSFLPLKMKNHQWAIQHFPYDIQRQKNPNPHENDPNTPTPHLIPLPPLTELLTPQQLEIFSTFHTPPPTNAKSKSAAPSKFSSPSLTPTPAPLTRSSAKNAKTQNISLPTNPQPSSQKNEKAK